MTQKVNYPISIVLEGAPGSGKTAVATAFQEEFLKRTGEHVCVHDNPSLEIQEKFKRPVGVQGDYRDHLESHFLRQRYEFDSKNIDESYIVCGSVIEDLAHAGVKVDDIRTGFQTPDFEQKMLKQTHTATVLTFLLMDSWRYTFGFYIPLKETSSVIVPGQDSADDAYARRLDLAIQTIFQNFRIPIQLLDQPSVEEKATEMVETVVAIMEGGVPEETEETIPPVEAATVSE